LPAALLLPVALVVELLAPVTELVDALEVLLAEVEATEAEEADSDEDTEAETEEETDPDADADTEDEAVADPVAVAPLMPNSGL